MNAIYLLVIGCGIFATSSCVLGLLLRIIHSKKVVKIITIIMHLIIIFGMILPLLNGIVSLVYGVNYDELLGIQSLPFPTISRTVGGVMFLIGQGLMLISIALLAASGEGFFLIGLTKQLALDVLYERTRNPMMLGLFLTVIGIGLFTGSTFFTVWSLIVFIPTVIFYLKFFEERELEMRFGESYREYKQRVPFLIPRFRKKSGAKSINNND